MSDDKLRAIADWRNSTLFERRERLGLDLAERMTITDLDTDDAFYAELAAEFTEPELVELVAICGFENFSSKFNHVFRIEEQKFCVIPPRPPDAPA